MSKAPVCSGRSATYNAGDVKWRNIAIGQLSTSTAASPVNDTWNTVRIAGTYSNLLVRIPSNATTSPSTGNFVADVTGPTVGNGTISVGAGATGEFEDLTHTDAVVAGNQINMKFTNGGGGTSTEGVAGICFSATVNTSCWLGGFNLFPTAGQTRYNRFPNPGGASSTEDADKQLKFRTAGTLKFGTCGILLNNTQTGADTATYGMRVAGVSGTVVVSVGAGVSGQVEDASSHADPVAVGDLVNRILIQNGGTGTCGGLHSISFETLDNSMMQCVQSTTTGGTSIATSATKYDPLSGFLQFTTAESDTRTKCGIAATASLYEAYIASNGITAASTITFRKNGVAGNGVISISPSATGWVEDIAHNDVLLPNDELDWETATGGTGTTMGLVTIAVKLQSPVLTPQVVSSPLNRVFSPYIEGWI